MSCSCSVIRGGSSTWHSVKGRVANVEIPVDLLAASPQVTSVQLDNLNLALTADKLVASLPKDVQDLVLGNDLIETFPSNVASLSALKTLYVYRSDLVVECAGALGAHDRCVCRLGTCATTRSRRSARLSTRRHSRPCASCSRSSCLDPRAGEDVARLTRIARSLHFIAPIKQDADEQRLCRVPSRASQDTQDLVRTLGSYSKALRTSLALLLY